MDRKICLGCGLELSIASFEKRLKNVDGRRNKCRSCRALTLKPYIPDLDRVCPKCGIIDRYKDGKCRKCSRDYLRSRILWRRDYTKRNKAWIDAQNGQYRLEHREEIKQRRANYKRGHKKETAAASRRLRLRLYGLTRDQYEQMLIDSCGRCACCNHQFQNTNTEPCIDHNHQTKIARGLICHICNSGIGMLGDSLEGCIKAIRYLEIAGEGTESFNEDCGV